MTLKKGLFIAALILIGLVGFYMLFSSGKVSIDPFSLVLFILVGGFIIYFYIARLQHKD